MNARQLSTLMKDMESDRVERKESASDGDKIRQAICAFANDLPDHRKPGVIFVGVTDAGACANLRITDELLRTLADMRSDGNITPFPSMTVQKMKVRKCEMAVVTVLPADAPPVRYKGRVWIRVGPRRAIASAEEERRLTEKRRARDLPYDLRPAPSAAVGDLDLDIFRKTYLPASIPGEILEQNRRSVELQLASLRFLAPGKDRFPTNLGILSVGKDPRQFIPCAYIQFLRFEGKDLTAPVKDQKEIDGPLPELLRTLDETLQINISVATNLTGAAVEIRRPDYPIVALQQIARNAVLHRSYEGTNAPVRIHWFSDRVEIQNPGGPFGIVRPDNFGNPGVADYRNPHLAEAMKNLGYVQRFGIGIALARTELQKNGNPALEFVVEPTHVLAVLRRRP